MLPYHLRTLNSKHEQVLKTHRCSCSWPSGHPGFHGGVGYTPWKRSCSWSQNRRAAKLDTNSGYTTNKGIAWTFLRSLPLLKQECQCEKREHSWDFYSTSSTHAFELLLFSQGTQLSGYTSISEGGPYSWPWPLPGTPESFWILRINTQ